MLRLFSFLTLLSVSLPALAAEENQQAPAEPAGMRSLFNGKDLTGWKTLKGESLDGKTEAYNKRFVVRDGMLILDPSVRGDVRIVTAKELPGDMHIKFEFEPDAKCNNDLFIRGQKFDLVKGNVKNIEFDKWNVPKVDPVTFESTRKGVFFGGDAAFGPKNIIWAVEHGHQAAISIHRHCEGLSPAERMPRGVNLQSRKVGMQEWSYKNDYDGRERRLMPHVNLKERFKRLDILVGNAGVGGVLSPVGHVSPKDWEEVIATNLTANLVGELTPASVTVNATANYTLTGTGKITGTTGLTKTNSGTLTILTTNDFTGPTIIGGGTLSASRLAPGGAPSSIGAAPADSANLIFSNSRLS